MTYRYTGFLTPALVLLLISLLIGPSATVANLEGFSGRLRRVPAEPIDFSLASRPRGLDNLEDDTPRYVFLKMHGEPLAQVYVARQKAGLRAMSPSLQRSYLQKLIEAQEQLGPRIEALGIPTISTYQKVLNGIQVWARPSQFGALLALPSVESIHPVQIVVPLLGNSVPHIGATRVIQELGVDGTDVDVGIIDTGIDYTHADFGGPGTAGAYAANDNTIISDTFEGALLFPTAKVVGGFDFVGELYDAGCSDQEIAAGDCTRTPQPDPDPMDDGNHGTHVAGIVAGIGTGTIAHGVAPGARLWALKIFGAQGSTNLTIDAIEYAVDPDGDGDISDSLDVLNMSLGCVYSCGGVDNSTEAMAIANFTAVGGIVVASAGNSGDVPLITSTPAGIPQAISVASSHGPDEFALAVRVNSPADVAGDYEAVEAAFTPAIHISRSELTDVISDFSSRGPAYPFRHVGGQRVYAKPDITAPGSNIFSALAGTGSEGASFSGTSMSSPHVAGVAALLKQLRPDWSSRELKALMMNTSRPDMYLDGNPNFGGNGTLAPITRQGAGLIDAMGAANGTAVAYADPSVTVDLGFQAVASVVSHTRRITVVNKSDVAVSYTVDFAFRDADDEDAGVTVRPPNDTITVPAGDTASFDIVVEVDPAHLKDWGLNAGATGNGNILRDIEYDGYLTLSPVAPSAGSSMRLPFHLLPRKTAALQTNVERLTLAPGSEVTVQFTNGSAVPGTAEVFTLVGQDPNEPASSDSLDVRAAGVRHSYVDGVGNVLEFAFTTYDYRMHPDLIEIDVYIDVNQDGNADYMLFNRDLGLIQGSNYEGQNVTALLDLVTEEVLLEFDTISDLFTSNIVLPVLAEDIGLSGGDLPFDYWATVFDNFGGGTTDVLPDDAFDTSTHYTFNGSQPRYVIEPASLDVPPAAEVRVFADPVADPSASTEEGLLVLYYPNEPGEAEAGLVLIGNPRLYLEPGSSSAVVDQIFTIDIKADADTATADTVDAYIRFDPTYLEVVDATGAPANSIELNTEVFSSATFNSVGNEAGQIDFSATRFDAPLVGNFVAATIRFRAKAATGSTTLTLMRSGLRISDLYQGGDPLNTVITNATLSISLSLTLNGQVSLERRGDPGDDRWITQLYRESEGGIKVYQAGSTTVLGTFSATTDANGRFSVELTDIEPGTYDISVKGANTLSNKRFSITLPSDTEIDFGALRVGDSNGDDRVNGADVSYMVPSFLLCAGDEGFRPYADTNKDGCINGADVSALVPNFLKSGDDVG